MSVSPDQSTAVASPLPANHVQLAPGAVAKIRNPILVVVFSLITLGIYQVFWWYYVNREMADYGRARGPTSSVTTRPSRRSRSSRGAHRRAGHLDHVTTFQRIQAAQRLTRQVPINGGSAWSSSS